MGKRNLKWQFKIAIEKNFKENMGKHSIKRAGKMDSTKIYSYSDRRNLIDFSANLANFLKENHKEIKYVKDISDDHLQSFLNEKAKNCSKKTLEQYGSKIRKLENIVNSTYKNANANYSGFIIPESHKSTKIMRDIAMDKEDFRKLQNSFKDSNSCAKIAIELSDRIGLRVEEIVKMKSSDIDLNAGKYGEVKVVDSKGRRSRIVEISNEEDREYFRDLKNNYGENERFCPVKTDSINKSIRRNMKKIGIDEKYEKTTIHSIRKKYAQERYDTYRKNGYNKKDALNRVSKDLGHGKDRDDLIKRYVIKIK